MDREDLLAYAFKKSILSAREVKRLINIAGNFACLFENRLSADEIKDEKLFLRYVTACDVIYKSYRSIMEDGKLFYSDLIRRRIKWSIVTKEDYPRKLYEIEDPPVIIYYLGNLPSSDCLSVAIIGARQCSEYGYKCAVEFAQSFSKAGIQIISGLARGVDGVSQRKAIESGGSTFGVLGNGVDIVYPKENDDIFANICDKGGLLSEFEPGIAPNRRNFPARNRIISALSDVVLVIEAREQSGTLITVNQALEQGKEVYAVPGRITDSLSYGCNKLISEGAGIAYNPQMMLEGLGISYFNIEDRKDKCYDNNVLNALSNGPATISELYNILSDLMNYNELLLEITELEISGIIGRRGDSIFQI